MKTAMITLVLAGSLAALLAQPAIPGLALIPAGTFEMGDHHGFVDPKHGSDELPIHKVRLDAFYMGVFDVTTKEYCEFLNSALGKGQLEVRQGGVFFAGAADLLCETRQATPSSRIGWDGKAFSVLDKKENHPIVCVRWHGAAAYCNWLSAQKELPVCYSTATWECDLNKSGYRLPTEAEWEYAARGGKQSPYYNYPWGDDADPNKANVPESSNPFRLGTKSAPENGRNASPPAGEKGKGKGPGKGERQPGGPGGERRLGPEPRTTPVGFFNGTLQRKSDFAWPGEAETFQTANNVNGYGLYDMAGNVWQWCTDWYERNYYAYSPAENPPGPAQGSPMPDGKAYRCMRGGSWFNGEFGHSRVSNRDPAYYRGSDPATGKGDPDGSYFHIGFRVVLPLNAESRPLNKPTPVQVVQRNEGGPGAGRPPGGAQKGKAPPGGGPRQRNPGEAPPNSRPPREAGGVEGERRQAPVEVANMGQKPMGFFVLRSPAFGSDGAYPKEFTGDGEGVTPPLEWSGAPAETKSFAIILHHTNRGQTMTYWVIYNLPANINRLPRAVTGLGTVGMSSRGNHAAYSPPHSSGPGTRTYVFTLYALSAPPAVSGAVTSEALLAAMKDKILATADLQVNYTRYTLGESQPNANPRSAQAEEGPRRASEPQPNRVRPMETPGGRPEGPGGGRPMEGPSAGRGKASGGGGRIAEHNQTPKSPNPGQTVGVFINSPKAYVGYTLLAPKHNTNIFLINNEGQILHRWNSQYYPGQSVYLKTNGNLLHPCMTRNRSFTGGGEGGRIEEYSWDGKLLWGFPYATDQYQQHHDIAPMPNGNILMLVVEKKTMAQCLAAGWPSGGESGELYPDGVVEVQPIYPDGGKVVWEWHVWDHMVQNFDSAKPNYGDPAAHPELIAIRGGRGGPNGFWNHANSIAYNPQLDQIIVSARGQSEIWFIDHSTTRQEAAGHTGGKHGKGGDLIYRWGNPAAYGRGSERDWQLNQQHDGEWVPAGYPGAGHVTIFNNGYNRGYSSIEEIIPPLDASGRYVLAPGKAYGPEKTFWHYEAPNRTDFFSSEISGAHRLPNGNTLVCAGVIGHLFEVTPSGEMVWQYVNPATRYGILAQGELPGTDGRGHLFNAVFKAHRYAPDYAAFAGRDLKPQGLVELPEAMKGKTGLHLANAVPGERPADPGGKGGGGPGGGKAGGPGGKKGKAGGPPRDRQN